MNKVNLLLIEENNKALFIVIGTGNVLHADYE